ncbi:MAG: DUF3048 domain-containing protein, partial [Actinobacteria bacterium]|nr:DUF3048 domain-containing protein [Actinomycetota bacterium]
ENADVVYEEPVEGRLTRFIAVYQCKDADRLGPIRSVRLVDADVIRQFAHAGSQPLVAHSGGIREIVARIPDAGLNDIGFDRQPAAYERDPAREMPHNLYSSMADLYEAAEDPTGVPLPMFTYDAREPTGAEPGAVVHVPFGPSVDTDVFWKWAPGKRAYVRLHGKTPHTVESGAQIQAKNVIVQYVQTRPTEFVDVNGAPVIEIGSIGQGDAVVFRNGKAIQGTWVRPFAEDVTVFKDARGREIEFAPGNTWIELVPVEVGANFS